MRERGKLNRRTFMGAVGAAAGAAVTGFWARKDFSALIVDLASGSGSWRNLTTYQDLKARQSILLYCFHKYDPETRVIPSGLPNAGLPYILTTTDEIFGNSTLQNHVACIRVNQSVVSTSAPNPAPFGKLAHYSYWTPCMITPASSPPLQYEFYDYVADGNAYELGNDVTYNVAPSCPGKACDLFSDIDPGNSGSLFFTELRAGLKNANYLCAQQTALNAYFNYLKGIGYDTSGCTPPSGCAGSGTTCAS